MTFVLLATIAILLIGDWLLNDDNFRPRH